MAGINRILAIIRLIPAIILFKCFAFALQVCSKGF